MKLLSPILLLALALLPASGTPAMRVLKTAGGGVPVLMNGGFEQERDGKPVTWSPWGQGYRLAPGEGRGGSQGVTCERREGGGEYGISQTLTLDRTNVAPLVIRGWSKAREVSGSPDNGYSLYADIIYADGSSLWAQTADFSCGTHDWEKREFVLLPDKPVKLLTLHCLLRGHTGKVWFDDVSVVERQRPAGAMLFQGVPVEQVAEVKPDAKAARQTLATRDGLKLTLRGTTITSLQLDGKDLRTASPAGFLVRDFATDSDVCGFAGGTCAELGLKLETTFSPGSNHIAVAGRITDTTGRDRAVTLLFALPLDARGWRWGDDVRQSRFIGGSDEFDNCISLRCGANGKMSLYPLAAAWSERAGVALGLDMDHPAQYRLVYHAGTKQFFIAYDFGLTKDTARFPGSADFRFVLYRFDPRGGFRAALQKYYDLFPQQFAKRVSREGVWMPFADIAKVPGFEDFGFAFQEGGCNVAFDDQHGIASFVYVEPMSHWLAMPRGAPRTYASAMSILKEDLAGARGKTGADMAAATLTSGIETADGQLLLHLLNTPWCDGGVFTLNPDPEIATAAGQPFNKAMVMREAIEAAFQKNQPAGRTNAPNAGLDGVYLDSFEMGASELNYRREHFRTARVPLVFDREGRPCQLMVLNTWAFERDIAEQLHARGKLLFANAVLWQFAVAAPPLDVLGTEVNWLQEGKYVPDPDALMNFRRALCRQKPYCLLMNTDYAKFTPELVERYFQRCLFYGVWPGFFDAEAASKDPYWVSAKKWYERDRALFREYIPLLRSLTAAGWQPLTEASCDNPKMLVERFGPGAGGAVFLTLLNDTTEAQSGTLAVDLKALGFNRAPTARELVTGTSATPVDGGWRLSLRPHQSEVLCLRRSLK